MPISWIYCSATGIMSAICNIWSFSKKGISQEKALVFNLPWLYTWRTYLTQPASVCRDCYGNLCITIIHNILALSPSHLWSFHYQGPFSAIFLAFTLANEIMNFPGRWNYVLRVWVHHAIPQCVRQKLYYFTPHCTSSQSFCHMRCATHANSHTLPTLIMG
jgi:hypothetical protein